MIGVFLRPDVTQIVKAVQRKQVLHMIETVDLPLTYYDNLQAKEIRPLVEMFKAIGNAVGILYEEIYIVVPDELFSYIDCGEYAYASNTDEQVQVWLEERLNIRSSDYYTSFPIEIMNNVRHSKTSFSIAKDIVDCLVDAAKAADVSLVSVEPASLAYLRALDKWKEEHALLEVFYDSANFVTYSPIAGIFKLPTGNLSLKNLQAMNDDEKRKALQSALTEQDIVAQKTFGFTNVDMGVELLSPDQTFVNYLREMGRKADVSGTMPCIKADMSQEELREFAVPIGTILQTLEESLYQNLPQYLRIGQANVLPTEVRVESRLERVKKKTKQYCRVGICALSFLLLLEGGGIMYFGNFAIPEDLQTAYESAQQQMPQIDKELAVIKQQKLEHQYPLDALRALIASKPDTLRFDNVEIGQPGKADAKQWITLNAQAPDPILFRNYAAVLEENTLFRGITIKQIATSTGGLREKEQKSATIMMGKGRMQF